MKKNNKKKQIKKEESNFDYSKAYSLEGEYRAQCWFDGWYMIGGGLKIPAASCKEAKELAEKYRAEANLNHSSSAE